MHRRHGLQVCAPGQTGRHKTDQFLPTTNPGPILYASFHLFQTVPMPNGSPTKYNIPCWFIPKKEVERLSLDGAHQGNNPTLPAAARWHYSKPSAAILRMGTEVAAPSLPFASPQSIPLPISQAS
jgi:hypothetical protein